jgi:hypothetical protein
MIPPKVMIRKQERRTYVRGNDVKSQQMMNFFPVSKRE